MEVLDLDLQQFGLAFNIVAEWQLDNIKKQDLWEEWEEKESNLEPWQDGPEDIEEPNLPGGGFFRSFTSEATISALAEGYPCPERTFPIKSIYVEMDFDWKDCWFYLAAWGNIRYPCIVPGAFEVTRDHGHDWRGMLCEERVVDCVCDIFCA